VTTREVRTALAIAATDSSGGAGLIADVRTIAAFGVWPLVAVTAITAQSTRAVHAVEAVGTETVAAQIDAVATDIGIDAVKIGVVASTANARMLRACLTRLAAPVVLDPVLKASTGREFADDDLVAVLREELVPIAALVTPNIDEAGALCGTEPPTSRAAMEACGRAVVAMGARAALVTGGHLGGDVVADVLVRPGREAQWWTAARVETTTTHGTGCVLSAGIAARLALGDPLEDAVGRARDYLRGALERGVTLGSGPGAVRPW